MFDCIEPITETTETTETTDNVIDFATAGAATKVTHAGERIVAPAIALDGGKAISVTSPSYYSTVEKHVIMDGSHGFIFADQYGFVTSAGRFVRRHRALQIARAAGQAPEKLVNEKIGLSPEDLWPPATPAPITVGGHPGGPPPGPRYA
jgi:hypothetical protein